MSTGHAQTLDGAVACDDRVQSHLALNTALSGRLGTTVGPTGRRFGGPPSPTGHDAPTRQGLGSDGPELPNRGLLTIRLPFAKFIFTTSCWLAKCKLDDVPPELARG